MCFVAVLLVGCPSGDAATERTGEAGLPAGARARLQRALERHRREAGSPGAQAAVVFADGTLWTGASGLADVEDGEPVKTDTLFAMGSTMKLHTAALVLDLVEDDVLSLHDPLARWVPEWPGGDEITIRQLLLHTSGLARVAGSDVPAALAADPDHHLSHDDLMLEPACAPGACYHYQSPDYDLVGEVIERATGHSFAREVRSRLWDPLGLADTYFPSQEAVDAHSATGYALDAPRPAGEVATCREDDVDNPYPCAGGGLLATAADVARFADALLAGDVLEPSSLEELLDFEATQGLTGVEECSAVGLGLVRTGTPEWGESWSHGGFTGSFHSSVVYYPRYDLTVAVAMNDGGDTGGLEGALREAAAEEAPVANPEAGTGFCNFDVYVMDRAGGERRRLTDDPAVDGGAISWAPDSRRMVFGSGRTGNADIFVMDAGGAGQVNLTLHPADDVAPSWSPDGRTIAFHSDRGGSNDIYVMDADGSDVRPVTRGPADDIVPAWSPDGSKIAYASGPATDDHDIWIVNADGSHRRRLTRADSDEWWPSWSPDGSRIAFSSDRRVVGGGGIAIVDVETRRVSVLELAVDGPNFPAWSSAGSIALVDFSGDIWTVAPDGLGLRRLTATGEREFQPGWSPDGRRLAFPAARWVDRPGVAGR
nr:beta-lactamase [uncultured bacterium]